MFRRERSHHARHRFGHRGGTFVFECLDEPMSRCVGEQSENIRFGRGPGDEVLPALRAKRWDLDALTKDALGRKNEVKECLHHRVLRHDITLPELESQRED